MEEPRNEIRILRLRGLEESMTQSSKDGRHDSRQFEIEHTVFRHTGRQNTILYPNSTRRNVQYYKLGIGKWLWNFQRWNQKETKPGAERAQFSLLHPAFERRKDEWGRILSHNNVHCVHATKLSRNTSFRQQPYANISRLEYSR